MTAERTGIKEAPSLLGALQNRETLNEGMEKTFDIFEPAVYKYTLRLCHDPVIADNIAGDVFAILYEQVTEGKGPKENLRSYLYQIAYHLVIDRSRDNQHNAPLEVANDSYPEGEFAPTQSQVEDRVMLEAVILAVNTELTEDQRHVVILRFLEDFTLKETGEILGHRINWVKVVQNRGIAKIRKAMGINLEEENDYDGMSLAG